MGRPAVSTGRRCIRPSAVTPRSSAAGCTRPATFWSAYPKPLHAAVRAVLRQAWGLDDADKAERLIRNLARRLEQQAPGVAASILEGLDEILTVICLGLPGDPRRSLACTNNGSGAALFCHSQLARSRTPC